MESDVVFMRIWLAVQGRAPSSEFCPNPEYSPYTGVDPAECEVMGWWRDAEKLVVRQKVRKSFIYTGFLLS